MPSTTTTTAPTVSTEGPATTPTPVLTTPTTTAPSSQTPSKTATASTLVETASNTAPAPAPAPALAMGHRTRKGVLYTTAVVLPPLAVYFRRGSDKDLFLSIVLTILGWIPGVLHAMYLVSK